MSPYWQKEKQISLWYLYMKLPLVAPEWTRVDHYDIISPNIAAKKEEKKQALLLSWRWDDWGVAQTVDSNLTAIHQSPKSAAAVYDPTPINTKIERKKKLICDRKKKKKKQNSVAIEILWLISISGVKIVLFVCWQMNNDLCSCVSLACFSCAAGYDVCARGAGMEDVPDKWGKEANLWCSSLQLVHCDWKKKPHRWAQLNTWDRGKQCVCGGWVYLIPVLVRTLVPHEKCCNLETDNEPWSCRKLQLCWRIAPSQFLSFPCHP